MHKLVIMYITTISVRVKATLSASLLELPVFSPKALAQILHINNSLAPRVGIAPTSHALQARANLSQLSWGTTYR